jgi:hypothetical protein
MLIEVELLKKESLQVIGGLREYETVAMKLSTLMSVAKSDVDPEKWTDAYFMGLPSTLTVNEPFASFVAKVNSLSGGRWDEQETEAHPQAFASRLVKDGIAKEPGVR